VNSREKLQLCYELAFYPPRLNEFWGKVKRGEITATSETVEMLDTALLLHQALPESGYASQRALKRLACYQADARAFGMPRFIRNIRKHLACPSFKQRLIPGKLVRDIGMDSCCFHTINVSQMQHTSNRPMEKAGH